MRSLQTLNFLRQQGFKYLKSVKGGITVWSEEIDQSAKALSASRLMDPYAIQNGHFVGSTGINVGFQPGNARDIRGNDLEGRRGAQIRRALEPIVARRDTLPRHTGTRRAVGDANDAKR